MCREEREVQRVQSEIDFNAGTGTRGRESEINVRRGWRPSKGVEGRTRGLSQFTEHEGLARRRRSSIPRFLASDIYQSK